MKSVIIGIHGLGNKPPRDLLQSWWLRSIREGLQNYGSGNLKFEFDMAYWADVIHPVPLDPYITNPDAPLYLEEPYTPGGTVKKEDPSQLIRDVLKYLEKQMDRIFLNDDMTINFRNVTDKLIHLYFSDLERYYGEKCVPASDQDCSAREAIQQRLLRKLRQYRGYRIMLIAHSMGSIVSYDVLSSLDASGRIQTLVTLGSPLGLPIIVGRIHETGKKRGSESAHPAVPESIVESWINMADLRDRIALDQSLADDYSANSRGLVAEDKSVFNDYAVNGKANPHKSFGYLRTPEMAETITGFIEQGRSRYYRAYLALADKITSGLRSAARSFKGD